MPGPVMEESDTTARLLTRFSWALVMVAHADIWISRKSMVHQRAMAFRTLTHSLITVSVMSRDLGILLIFVTRARMFLAWRLMLPALSWKRSTRPVSTFTMAVRSASRRVTHACSIITLSAGDNSGAILAASAWERALAISSKRKQGSFFITLQR